MKLEIKNIKIMESLSEETICFSANIYVNGKMAGFAENRGNGGCTDYFHSNTPDSKQLIKEAEDYCISLPDQKYDDFTLKMNLELFIDNAIDAHYNELQIAKQKKKFDKLMVNHIIVGKRGNFTEFGVYKYKQPIATILSMKDGHKAVQASLARISEKLKDGQEILNTNIPAELFPKKIIA